MKLTFDQQTEILYKACKACGMNGHIQTTGNTVAEKLMQMFGGKRKQPHKNSYLLCAQVDACFFIKDDRACCTFSARWYADSSDLDHLGRAGAMIKKLLHEIQRRIDDPAVGQE